MKQNSEKKHYPPVVSALGHVDHGKTSLLDAIRKTSEVDRESGGITQKIGASTVSVTHDGVLRDITFLDTPGHEAFSAMRSRGADASDIVLLIVSSVDGVKPQTVECINILKNSNTPYIVVLTKIDLDNSNPNMAIQHLLKEGLKLEGYGGETPLIQVSSKTNKNIHELLELILLVEDMKTGNVRSEDGEFEGIIIESFLDKKIGPKASIVVKNGTLKLRDEIASDDAIARVRSMIDQSGKMISTLSVGYAAEVLGFTSVPKVGSIVKLGNKFLKQEEIKQSMAKKLTYEVDESTGKVSVVLVADSQGSLEAIEQSLPKEINIIKSKTGEVTHDDIMLAKTTKGLVISFNTKISNDTKKLAIGERVIAKNYNVIYELLDELGDVVEGKRLETETQYYGKAKILASFPFDKQIVLGISVIEGRVAKGDRISLVRNDEIIGQASIASLRQGKEVTSKASEGQEAGIILSKALDFLVGDMIVSHS